MKKAFRWILSSFDTITKGGLSSRKATAFALTVCVLFLHYKYAAQNATTFLLYDLTAIFLLLGVVTVEQIIKFKNGSADLSRQIEPKDESPQP